MSSWYSLQNRQELLSAANKVAEAQSALFQAMSSTGYMEPGFQVIVFYFQLFLSIFNLFN